LPSSAARKCTLNTFLNGSVAPRLQYWGGPVQTEYAAKQLTEAILPRSLPLFARHRWCTSRQTFAEAALLFSFCDGYLARDAILEWLHRADPDYDEAGSWNAVVSVAEPADDESKWSQLAAQARTDAADWARKLPGPRLIAMVLTMAPQVIMMNALLRKGSRAWELEQMFASVQLGSASFHVVEAASRTDTLAFFAEVRTLLDPSYDTHEFWAKFLPERALSYALCATIFAMLTRAAAGVHFSLYKYQHEWPLRLFGLLRNPDVAEEV
jgi:hypothetical protein